MNTLTKQLIKPYLKEELTANKCHGVYLYLDNGEVKFQHHFINPLQDIERLKRNNLLLTSKLYPDATK